MVPEINKDNFEKEVSGSTIPVAVDFSAPWCPPCKKFTPIFEKTSDQYKDRIKFAKMDTDANREFARSYGISSIPTIILYNHGKEVARFSGYMSEEQFKKWLHHHLPNLHPQTITH